MRYLPIFADRTLSLHDACPVKLRQEKSGLVRATLFGCARILFATQFLGCDFFPVDLIGENAEVVALTGVVREDETNLPVAGATVKVNGISTTTDSEGIYTVATLSPESSLHIQAASTGHETYDDSIAVSGGRITHDIVLIQKTGFASLSSFAYLSPKISVFRGVFLHQPPSTGDNRPFLSGESVPTFPGSDELVTFFARVKEFSLAHQLAVVARADDVHDIIPDELAAIAAQSGHAEIAEIPLLIFGYSAGSNKGYEFSVEHSESIAGLIAIKGGSHYPIDAGPAKAAPAYFVTGEFEEQRRIENVTDVFQTNRPQGAPWTYAVEPGAGHEFLPDDDRTTLFLDWVEAILSIRLSTGSGGATELLPVDETLGWLGNLETFSVGSYDCFNGDKTKASWLPSEKTALQWQAFVSGGTASDVDSC